MATAHSMKVTLVLNEVGQVAGAVKHPETAGDASATTYGMAAGLGQTLVQVEVPAHLASMEAQEFLAHLADHDATKAVMGTLQGMKASAQSAAPVAGTL